MKDVTDMDKIKEVANILLNIEPRRIEGVSFFLSHPFFSSELNPYKSSYDNDIHFTNIMESRNNLNMARRFMEEQINKIANVHILMCKMNRPYRAAFFSVIEEYLSKDDFAELLEYVWTDAENPNQDPNVEIDDWIDFFKRADKEKLMTEEDYKKYKELKKNKTLKIYRGVGTDREVYGLSWTCNKDTALWFAKRWGEERISLLETEVNTDAILAYFNTRNENELIIDIDYLGYVERHDL